MDERNHLYRERYVDSWMASIIAVGLCVLPACCIRWAVSRLEDQERAAKLFGRSLAVLQGVAGLAFIVWTRCCSYGRWPKGLELYAAIGWCIQVLLVRSYGIAHEERLACIASVAAFFIAAPRLTDMTYSEQVGLFWSALLLGEVIGHGFELLERQHYFNTLRTDTHKATAAAPTTDAMICCGFALAAVDPNLGLFTVPVSIIYLYKRVRCHAMADLEAAFTSFWWTHVAIEVIISGVTCPASFYYSMADMKRLKEQVEEDRVSASGMTWLFRAGRQATFNTYMKGTPSWVAFLLVIISVLHIVVRSMGMPLSSPRSFALRHTIGLCRFVTEFRVVALLMGQYTMVILSQLGGLAFTHLFELQQRRTTLALLKLSQDITNPTFPATEQEGLRLSKAFQGSVLPISVLRARIDFVDLQIGQVIGSGTFGVVHKGTWFDGAATRGGKRQVAVKTLHRTRLTERDLNAFVRTAEFELRLPPHRNIVRLLGLAWSIDSARISGVYEVCVGGSFSDALGARSRAWTTAQKVGFARQLADGLAFLHEQEPPILHRDLKPENILLDAASGCPTPKIADFGTACQRSSHMTSDISTPLFSAPEILARMPYDASVDVWAFGCCLACLFNNKHSPYVFEASDGVDELYAASARQTDEALRRVSKGLLRPTLADGEHTEEYAAMSTLLDECCAHNSVDRPSSQVLKVKLAAVPISEF